jgi:hypothetical protein
VYLQFNSLKGTAFSFPIRLDTTLERNICIYYSWDPGTQHIAIIWPYLVISSFSQQIFLCFPKSGDTKSSLRDRFPGFRVLVVLREISKQPTGSVQTIVIKCSMVEGSLLLGFGSEG